MALGAVPAAYPVIAGRFKDYISTPKSNGYQSLHTGVTLREPRNQKIEVQIRTPEMHDVADNGVAAHWLYKQGDASRAEVQRFRWVQDLLEILDNSQAADDFLENTKLELYQDQVFCFTPKGQLIQLPRGATPVDFAYAVHSQVGDTCVGAKVNGRLMPLRVIQWGTGAVGTEILATILDHRPDLELVGVELFSAVPAAHRPRWSGSCVGRPGTRPSRPPTACSSSS